MNTQFQMNFVDMHKAEININDLSFDGKIVNFVIVTETEIGRNLQKREI